MNLRKIILIASLIAMHHNAGPAMQQSLITIQTNEKPIIYTTRINDTTFFAIKPHVCKIKNGQTPSRQELLKRFTPEHHAWYADGCNNSELNTLIDAFITHIQEQIFSKTPKKEKPFLAIFDIDETVLTQYGTLFRLVKNDVENNTQTEHSMTTLTPSFRYLDPITPMLKLYQFFIERGCKIAFITNRPDTEQHRSLTITQLNDFGYTAYDELHLRAQSQTGSTGQYKELLRSQLADTYDIVAIIDDNHENLQGKHLGVAVLWVPSLLAQYDAEVTFFEQMFLQD
ncbi:hypothetical protein JST56_02070 [Candidatus Dependentiae bacterium]|nr:hypothetical protein [Candidatus Dependentiae bacterium]